MSEILPARQETRIYCIQVKGDHASGLMAQKAPLERAILLKERKTCFQTNPSHFSLCTRAERTVGELSHLMAGMQVEPVEVLAIPY
jgi:hypothetical protein